jgi:glycerate 2-kinase
MPAAMSPAAAIERIYRASLARVEGRAAVRAALRRAGNRLTAGDLTLDLDEVDRIIVIGAGKASAAMAQGLEDALGDRITAGAITTKDGHALPTRRIVIHEAAHPTPDARCLAGARAMLDLLRGLTERDLVIALMSGGGSALVEAPVAGVGLDDLVALTRLLLRSGAVIHEMNAVRKHLSTIKGGGLARLAYPARLLNLMISDVIGDDLDTIASGPTVPDPTTFADALAVLDHYGLRAAVPAAVRAYLEAGVAGRAPETAKAGDPAFARVTNLLVATNELAVRAAAAEADRLGYRPLILSTLIQGEAREIARMWAAIGLQAARTGEPAAGPCCLLGGGEATVTVTGQGLGGRNTEMMLAAAIAIAGSRRLTLASLATDGSDGPTDAVGAIVDGGTVAAARAAGLDPRAALRDNDSYHFFARAGGLVKTGPTGTNVNDLYLALVEPASPAPG